MGTHTVTYLTGGEWHTHTPDRPITSKAQAEQIARKLYETSTYEATRATSKETTVDEIRHMSEEEKDQRANEIAASRTPWDSLSPQGRYARAWEDHELAKGDAIDFAASLDRFQPEDDLEAGL